MNNTSNIDKNKKGKGQGADIVPYSNIVDKKGRRLKAEIELKSAANLMGHNSIYFLMNGWW